MSKIYHSRLILFVACSLLAIGLLLLPPLAIDAAATGQHEDHDEDHAHHDHADHDHANEIAISTGYVYMDPEEESALGLHLHYLRRLPGEGFQRYFGLGVGFETIFAEVMHYNIMGSIAIFPYRSLAIVISPGVLIVKPEDEIKTRYSTHIEAAYGFMLGEYHVGPVIGFARAGEDTHYMIGIHLARGF